MLSTMNKESFYYSVSAAGEMVRSFLGNSREVRFHNMQLHEKGNFLLRASFLNYDFCISTFLIYVRSLFSINARDREWLMFLQLLIKLFSS